MAASGASTQMLLITCVAGLISGASSMAAGEYISVKSQVDIEEADLHMEAKELDKNPTHELKELTHISLYTTNFTEPLSYQDSAFLKLPKFP
jgi:VIT1/CCC1 family predicted Fe2+/Mn2+ transporter